MLSGEERRDFVLLLRSVIILPRFMNCVITCTREWRMFRAVFHFMFVQPAKLISWIKPLLWISLIIVDEVFRLFSPNEVQTLKGKSKEDSVDIIFKCREEIRFVCERQYCLAVLLVVFWRKISRLSKNKLMALPKNANFFKFMFRAWCLLICHIWYCNHWFNYPYIESPHICGTVVYMVPYLES